MVTLEELTAGARKTADGKVSVTDVIMVVKKCNRRVAAITLKRLQDEQRIPKLEMVVFGRTSLVPNPGRGGNRLPEAAADARQMVQLLWALPGDTEFRRNSADVVVRYLGGDPRMVNEILSNRAAQETLAREDPAHPARIFGEAVEAEGSACGNDVSVSLKRTREDAATDGAHAACVVRPSSKRLLELPDTRLEWKRDLKVDVKDLPGVKALFEVMLRVELEKQALTASSPVKAWARAPPLRFKALAQDAVSSYQAHLTRSSEATRDTPQATSSSDTVQGHQGESCDEDDDVLKVSEVMHAAGVWPGVWMSYRSDLANQMLVLKCAATQGNFSERRQEVVRGHTQVLVHKYKKSCDWPLAWTAVQKTRDLYEKRVRECLDDMLRLAGECPVGGLSTSDLARRVAASLRVQ